MSGFNLNSKKIPSCFNSPESRSKLELREEEERGGGGGAADWMFSVISTSVRFSFCSKISERSQTETLQEGEEERNHQDEVKIGKNRPPSPGGNIHQIGSSVGLRDQQRWLHRPSSVLESHRLRCLEPFSSFKQAPIRKPSVNSERNRTRRISPRGLGPGPEAPRPGPTASSCCQTQIKLEYLRRTNEGRVNPGLQCLLYF